MAWQKADILPRVEARAAELSMSVKDVLPAGSENFFAPSKAGASPQISTLERIAEALGWSLCGLLCGHDSEELHEDLHRLAIDIALRAIPDDRRELWSPAIISCYAVLSALRREGRPIDESTVETLTLHVGFQGSRSR